MILVDANILLYAEDCLSPDHKRARKWWDEKLSGSVSVYLPWMVINAFIRIGTNPRVFERPLILDEALHRVQSWMDQSCTRIAIPTKRHWEIFEYLLREGKASGNLVSDAHIAALSIEYGCELYSTDSDFARFPKVKWKNPLK